MRLPPTSLPDHVSSLFSPISRSFLPTTHLACCRITVGFAWPKTLSLNGTTKNGRLQFIFGKQFFCSSLGEILTSLFTHRPVLNGHRVPPSEFSEFWRTHIFRYPSCLCAMASPDGSAVTESVIFILTTPGLVGEYVAACMKKQCKYFGTLFSSHKLAIQSLPNFGYQQFWLNVCIQGLGYQYESSLSEVWIFTFNFLAHPFSCFSNGCTTPAPYRLRHWSLSRCRRCWGNYPDPCSKAHSSPR